MPRAVVAPVCPKIFRNFGWARLRTVGSDQLVRIFTSAKEFVTADEFRLPPKLSNKTARSLPESPVKRIRGSQDVMEPERTDIELNLFSSNA